MLVQIKNSCSSFFPYVGLFLNLHLCYSTFTVEGISKHNLLITKHKVLNHYLERSCAPFAQIESLRAHAKKPAFITSIIRKNLI